MRTADTPAGRRWGPVHHELRWQGPERSPTGWRCAAAAAPICHDMALNTPQHEAFPACNRPGASLYGVVAPLCQCDACDSSAWLRLHVASCFIYLAQVLFGRLAALDNAKPILVACEGVAPCVCDILHDMASESALLSLCPADWDTCHAAQERSCQACCADFAAGS